MARKLWPLVLMLSCSASANISISERELLELCYQSFHKLDAGVRSLPIHYDDLSNEGAYFFVWDKANGVTIRRQDRESEGYCYLDRTTGVGVAVFDFDATQFFSVAL
ncbi:hypothetical protein [Gallaecimonas sp. GXIMD4217]|uniref:hypothetical protein n=1 Tax=Gallaecimonas sp. GXIMD4217 TaxID=3131927 RepID=UPI00311AEFEF